jgi:hypothetical protein
MFGKYFQTDHNCFLPDLYLLTFIDYLSVLFEAYAIEAASVINKELHNLFSSNVIRMIKSRRMR